ncbi:MAG: cyclophilin-like fold protein [Candidatus Hodarchaeota archaeon]
MSVPIKIDLFGIGMIEADIIRHIAPLTADALIDKLPFVLRGRFSFGSKKYWTLPGVEIYKGSNPKSTKYIEEGDILYNPKTDELIIAITSNEMPNKVNKIGKVSNNLEILLQARNGLNTKFSKK